MDDFIKVHTKIPANPDTPYIVKSEMLPLGESPSNELYVNMSSQTIVNRLLKRPQIQVDFTYDVSVDNLMILMIGISNEGHEYLPISVVLTSRENEKKKDWNWRLSWKCKGRWCHSAMRSMLNLKKQFDWCAIPTCAGNVVSEESKLNRCVFLDFAPKKFESLPTLFLISHLFCFCSLIANSYLNLNLAKKEVLWHPQSNFNFFKFKLIEEKNVFFDSKTQLKRKIIFHRWTFHHYLWYNFCLAVIPHWRQTLTQ